MLVGMSAPSVCIYCEVEVFLDAGEGLTCPKCGRRTKDGITSPPSDPTTAIDLRSDMRATHSALSMDRAVCCRCEKIIVRNPGDRCEACNDRDAALRADAERLAELRREYDMLRMPMVELGIRPPEKTTHRIRSLESLIAVYEELAARGLTFGGGR